jgi:LuxR family maltose regulon positive regulatory protein
LLREGLNRPLTLISAPAGFGKTTLLSEWRASEAGRSFPLAWLSLDNDDNDASRFLIYLVSALGTLKAGMGESALAALQSPQPPPAKAILTALANDLNTLSAPFALVLDDYHVISSQSVHEALKFMIDHMPLQMHLVLLTRADPPLPLARLRASSQLTEIRTLDLRFIPEETAAFLNEVMGLELSTDQIDALETRTEGWIAGLQLAALSLRQQEDKQAFVAAFAGDDRYVVDYLLEEVLHRQSPAIQTFLLRTSILDRLCGPLCEAVTGEMNGQTILAYLEQANLFVTSLDNRRYWYRYHQLFADLLRQRLRQTLASSDWIAAYHRACAWYERQGLIVEAVSLSLAVPDVNYTADLLERHVLTIFFRGQTMLIHNWLKALPEAVLRAHPLLCAVYANTLAHTSYYQVDALHRTEDWLRAAEQALAGNQFQSDRTNSSDEHITRSFIALSYAYLALWRTEAPQKVIDLAQHALAGLPPADEAGIDPNYLRFHSGLNCNLGISYQRFGDEEAASRAFALARQIGGACGDLLNAFWGVYAQSMILRKHGRLTEASDFCQDALKSLCGTVHQPEPSIPYVGMIYVSLGQIQLEWNELDSAERLLVKGLELSRLTTGTDIPLQGSLALARLKQARGDIVGALDVLNQVEGGRGEAASLVACSRVRLWLAQGNLGAAVQWAKDRQFTSSHQAESFTLARVLIAERQAATQASQASLSSLEPLMQFLERQLQAVEESHWVERAIELLILLALACQAQDDISGALSSLQRALTLAEPGGYVRLFIDEGRPMRWLLVRMKDGSGRLKGYVSKLLAAWGESEVFPSSARPQALVEPLSVRELQVLCLLAAGDSNAEISRKLFITLNTTKKHITHIFEKLAVTDRTQAAERARELDLVV